MTLSKQKREKQKADQIRDQAFLVRKGDDNQAQLNSLLKDLDLDKNSGLPTPIPDRQAKAEEEAIAHVLRSSSPPAVQPEPFRNRHEEQRNLLRHTTATEVSANPMFVYSRSFGGAKYVDAPQKQAAAQLIMPPILRQK